MKSNSKYDRLKVVITTSNDNTLKITTLTNKEDDNLHFCKPGIIGCSIRNTKNYLGISKESWEIIKNIKKSGDDVSSINVYNNCFSWMGSPNCIVYPDCVELNYFDGDIPKIDFVTIPNNFLEKRNSIKK